MGNLNSKKKKSKRKGHKSSNSDPKAEVKKSRKGEGNVKNDNDMPIVEKKQVMTEIGKKREINDAKVGEKQSSDVQMTGKLPILNETMKRKAGDPNTPSPGRKMEVGEKIGARKKLLQKESKHEKQAKILLENPTFRRLLEGSWHLVYFCWYLQPGQEQRTKTEAEEKEKEPEQEQGTKTEADEKEKEPAMYFNFRCGTVGATLFSPLHIGSVGHWIHDLGVTDEDGTAIESFPLKMNRRELLEWINRQQSYRPEEKNASVCDISGSEGCGVRLYVTFCKDGSKYRELQESLNNIRNATGSPGENYAQLSVMLQYRFEHQKEWKNVKNWYWCDDPKQTAKDERPIYNGQEIAKLRFQGLSFNDAIPGWHKTKRDWHNYGTDMFFYEIDEENAVTDVNQLLHIKVPYADGKNIKEVFYIPKTFPFQVSPSFKDESGVLKDFYKNSCFPLRKSKEVAVKMNLEQRHDNFDFDEISEEEGSVSSSFGSVSTDGEIKNEAFGSGRVVNDKIYFIEKVPIDMKVVMENLDNKEEEKYHDHFFYIEKISCLGDVRKMFEEGKNDGEAIVFGSRCNCLSPKYKIQGDVDDEKDESFQKLATLFYRPLMKRKFVRLMEYLPVPNDTNDHWEAISICKKKYEWSEVDKKDQEEVEGVEYFREARFYFRFPNNMKRKRCHKKDDVTNILKSKFLGSESAVKCGFAKDSIKRGDYFFKDYPLMRKVSPWKVKNPERQPINKFQYQCFQYFSLVCPQGSSGFPVMCYLEVNPELSIHTVCGIVYNEHECFKILTPLVKPIASIHRNRKSGNDEKGPLLHMSLGDSEPHVSGISSFSCLGNLLHYGRVALKCAYNCLTELASNKYKDVELTQNEQAIFEEKLQLLWRKEIRTLLVDMHIKL